MKSTCKQKGKRMNDPGSDTYTYTRPSSRKYLISLGTFHDLIERVKGVAATDSILLEEAQVNICSDEDLEGVLIIPKSIKKNTQLVDYFSDCTVRCLDIKIIY